MYPVIRLIEKTAGRNVHKWHLLLPVALLLALNVVLYLTCERWRVYGNDILPARPSHFFDNIWFSQRLYFQVPFVAASVLAPLLALRSRALLGVAAIGVILVLVVQYHRLVVFRQRNAGSSCANHSNFWGGKLRRGIPKEQLDRSLPDTTEFAEFVHATSDGPEMDLSGIVCPGYKRVGTKTGVVFVGGGLSYRTLAEKDVLIAFCSWQSHKPPWDGQGLLRSENAYVWRKLAATRGAIEAIQRALEQARDGSVPYSPEAVTILEHELDMRLDFVRD